MAEEKEIRFQPTIPEEKRDDEARLKMKKELKEMVIKLIDEHDRVAPIPGVPIFNPYELLEAFTVDFREEDEAKVEAFIHGNLGIPASALFLIAVTANVDPGGYINGLWDGLMAFSQLETTTLEKEELNEAPEQPSDAN
jgi:hypothetical protein